MARAEDWYLYWMVDATGTEWLDSFTYAMLKETSTGNYLVDPQYGLDAIGAEADGLTTDKYDFVLPNEYMSSAYSFMVELYDESDIMVAWSRDVNFEELDGHYFSGINATGANPYVFSAFVPEPTSGMLFLLGIAALSLRRKSKLKK